MTVTKSDFDPTTLGQYEEPPAMLHFQWEGVRCGQSVFRYVLAEIIEPNEIDSRSKRKDDELKMSEEEVWEKVINELRDE